MRRPCTICQHPNRAAIEQDRAHGVSFAALRHRYDVDHLAVMNHVRFHGAVCDESTAAAVSTSDMSGMTGIGSTTASEMSLSITCACDWCTLTSYERLKRAWDEATDPDRQKLCADTREYEVPF